MQAPEPAQLFETDVVLFTAPAAPAASPRLGAVTWVRSGRAGLQPLRLEAASGLWLEDAAAPVVEAPLDTVRAPAAAACWARLRRQRVRGRRLSGTMSREALPRSSGRAAAAGGRLLRAADRPGPRLQPSLGACGAVLGGALTF